MSKDHEFKTFDFACLMGSFQILTSMFLALNDSYPCDLYPFISFNLGTKGLG